MSTRTQIYLTDHHYLDKQATPDQALAATLEVGKDFEVPSRDEWARGDLVDTDVFVRHLRDAGRFNCRPSQFPGEQALHNDYAGCRMYATLVA